jgi:hypothetical protein
VGEVRERHNRRKGSGRCEGGERAGWGGVKWGRVCIDSIVEGRSAYKEPGSEKAGGRDTVVAKELLEATTWRVLRSIKYD